MSRVFSSPANLWDVAMRSLAPDRRPQIDVGREERKERIAYRLAIAGRSKRADKKLRCFSWEEPKL